ncbi:hypothetical protein RFI_24726 [Reticulomyxa filosa]|uniref:Alpha/beta hydrolase n=1 Tax=Reticulomyxa filosa TaxID=46433 RepID=X6MHV7_RETFI|nr:hypothetical protein RFI_24726 [Reticulomyxa filosa]|eukprot:ETO12650.1 hypothetical protein RFI_24726 [Reticulomyxa filosa]
MFPFLPQFPRAKEIHAGMNYLYFYLWWRIFTGGAKEIGIKKGNIFNVPFLFFYGDKTPFKFHSPQFAQKMQQKPNRYIFLKDHSHWLMYDHNGKFFNQILFDWLQETDKLN